MRKRLLLSYLTITAFTLVVLVYPLGRVFSARERDRLLRDVERDATVVANLVEDSLEANALPHIEDLMASYARDPGGRIVVVNSNGRVVADSADSAAMGSNFSSRPELAEALSGGRAEGTRFSDTLGQDLLYVAVPVASGGRVHGAVRITYPSSALDARVRDTWIRLGVLSGLVVVLVTGVGFVLARSVSQPVDRLKEAARALAGGDLSARAPTARGAVELRELAHTFNHTAEQLEASMAAQQAFVADAAHQLRTPLAALRLRLENLEAQAPSELQPGLAAARSETTRLARLSDSLLALTRAVNAQVRVEPVDVAALVRERHEAWAPVAEESGVTLTLDAPPSAWATVAPGALEQVVDNYVDNALNVAPAGTTVRLVVRRTGNDVELHVIDAGRGLTEDQRRHAFDRFWRAPDATPGGTGLGLAIVAQLAAASGGRAALAAAPGGGVDAMVAVPACTPPTAPPPMPAPAPRPVELERR